MGTTEENNINLDAEAMEDVASAVTDLYSYTTSMLVELRESGLNKELFCDRILELIGTVLEVAVKLPRDDMLLHVYSTMEKALLRRMSWSYRQWPIERIEDK